jgi:2'-hydroxyisoflavone reductase
VKLLVLGGTSFLGRHIVELALRAAAEITLFNRGVTNPNLFPQATHLIGDRDGALDSLRGQGFDCVIDTSGFTPEAVRSTLDMLGDIGHYTFVSTMSVYTDRGRKAGEDGELVQLSEREQGGPGATYGPLKELSERVVRDRFPDAFIPRPGLIVGPHDPTGRFTYWPVRFFIGGRVLAPCPPTASVQVLDVRDLAAWIYHAAQVRLSGTYNAVSRPMSMSTVLEECRRSARSRGAPSSEIVWVDGQFLVEQGVRPWGELPLWVGPDDPDLLTAPSDRALAAGLHTRPVAETAAATLEWALSTSAERKGLDPDKEQRVLAAWEEQTHFAKLS